MKAIKVTPQKVSTMGSKLEVIELEEPAFQSISNHLGGGFFEIVRPKRQMFGPKIVFVCDDEGLLKLLPPNLIGTKWYGVPGHFIAGTILILKEDFTDDGMDFVPMTDEEIDQIVTLIKGQFQTIS